MFISSYVAVKIFELDEILHSFYILLSLPSIALPHTKNESQLNFGYLTDLSSILQREDRHKNMLIGYYWENLL